MALTLKQRANILKSVDLNLPVTFFEKVDASIKNHAGRYIKGVLLYADIPDIIVSGATSDQVTEWSKRSLDGNAMSYRMMSSIVSDPIIEPLGIDSTDDSIDLATLWCIARYASVIN